jgi:plasmid stabilization system protein ParE
MLDYFITPLARLHIDDAYQWYEGQETGRGDEFLVEFHERLRDIREHPEICCPVSNRSRVAKMRRSKYMIFFRIEAIGVVVLGVRHFASDADSRLESRL